MLVVMHKDATKDDIEKACNVIKEMGLTPHPILGVQRVAIGITGNKDMVDTNRIEVIPGVINIIHVTQPYKLASREMKPQDTIINMGNTKIGGRGIVIIAGPCAVESESNLLEIAEVVKAAGAKFLRGGAFKPRSSPYSFQGLGEKGLKILAKAKEKTGLLIVTEVLSEIDVPLVYKYADVFQIGARNMQNFPLLRTVGRFDKPVLLKRGMSATIEEWLMSAEYIFSEGNQNVILCERGIRTFEKYTRNTLDISAIPIVEHLSHLPIIVDPSHASGDWRYVSVLAKAAIAGGADGLMIEVHTNPTAALSDGKQSLKPEIFKQLMDEIRKIAGAIGRSV
jgi:3-deoxy-7-phosphoheptulonate synthase